MSDAETAGVHAGWRWAIIALAIGRLRHRHRRHADRVQPRRCPRRGHADVHVFENGIDGQGPLGHQKDVFPSAPGDGDHRSLREIVLVSWADESEARELTSAEEVEQAEADSAVSFERSGVVVNAPMLTWPDGER